MKKLILSVCCVVLFASQAASAQFAPALVAGITSPKEFLGFSLGDDYHMANYTQLEGYWRKLATESNRMKLVDR